MFRRGMNQLGIFLSMAQFRWLLQDAMNDDGNLSVVEVVRVLYPRDEAAGILRDDDVKGPPAKKTLKKSGGSYLVTHRAMVKHHAQTGGLKHLYQNTTVGMCVRRTDVRQER